LPEPQEEIGTDGGCGRHIRLVVPGALPDN
jgi:hypothetical protein